MRLQKYKKNLRIVINYNKISKKSSHIANFHSLYFENFPASERRDWDQEVALIDEEDRFHLLGAIDDGALVGFISYWMLEECCYIEHLAVSAPRRCAGLGGSLLRHVAGLGMPVLLEVEPPVDETTRRRVAFYQSHGLLLRDEVPYIQPPYSPGLPPVPMCIMTSPGMTVSQVTACVEELRRVVYRRSE